MSSPTMNWMCNGNLSTVKSQPSVQRDITSKEKEVHTRQMPVIQDARTPGQGGQGS